MKHSPYIQWAKRHHSVPYNLAGSGMPGFPLGKLTDDPAGLLQSGDHEDGWPPLINRIARRYGVAPEQVVTVSSASMANHLVCSLLLNPGDEVLVEDPAYEPLVSLPQYFRAKVVPLPRRTADGYQPDPAQARELISERTRLIILSDMHNPSGSKLDRAVLQQLIQMAESREIYLLIDEVYLEFLYPGGARTAAKQSEYVITTRSLTKAFGLDDVRIGWIIAEPSVARRLQRLKDLFSTTLPFPSERLGAAALDRADAILQHNITLLDRNRSLVAAFIRDEPALSWVEPPAGSVGFPRFAGGPADSLIELAHRQHETLVVPGRFFGRPDHFRIGWGISSEKLREGLHRLHQALGEIS